MWTDYLEEGADVGWVPVVQGNSLRKFWGLNYWWVKKRCLRSVLDTVACGCAVSCMWLLLSRIAAMWQWSHSHAEQGLSSRMTFRCMKKGWTILRKVLGNGEKSPPHKIFVHHNKPGMHNCALMWTDYLEEGADVGWVPVVQGNSLRNFLGHDLWWVKNHCWVKSKYLRSSVPSHTL